ncbi:MAG: glycoside hydrolase family 125 protein [Thermoplasmatales archaeon]|nr:glycoside hydrolase family 125 protein [Candidatus Thermoplasmatota archaeon]MDA8056257.1 glycoside hydrolase family 125 protein [Thermoplasmatales archaeon]
MSYDVSRRMVITSPNIVADQNYRMSANYFLSFTLKDDTLELCFPISSGSALVCFRIRRFISAEDFSGAGWIENNSREKEVKIIIPPYRPGFFIGAKASKSTRVDSYSKIFWEIPRPTENMKTNWSNSPAYYVSVGNCLPAIAFKEIEDSSFVGIGDTPDRAVLNAIHLSRIGETNLERETAEFMERFKEIKEKTVRDNVFMSIFNSNSIFVDKEESCIMASKSPKYYVSGGYWARDFIFWTFPIIEKYDLKRARELLSLLLGRYWKHKGIHSLYLDGRILYDGFELDQLAYYFIALERAIVHKVIEPEDSIVKASQLMDILISRRDVQYDLYSTDLNSSDDPVKYPYVTFDNVALWFSMRRYGAKVKELLLDKSYLEYSERIREDVLKALVVDNMFCYSSDLEGNFELYDDPTGSLLLLPYLGFIERESNVFKNTLAWILSDENEFKIGGKYSGLGNRHVRHPWIHSYVTQVLSGIKDISLLKNLPLDDGLSCETIDQETGKCLTGIHFPGSSAFLVQALLSKENGIRET